MFMETPALGLRPTGPREADGAEQQQMVAVLQRRGQLLSAEALQPLDTAVTVRQMAGHTDVVAGPISGSTGQLSAVYVINARDLNEAIRVMSQFPNCLAKIIEIRPLRDGSTVDLETPIEETRS